MIIREKMKGPEIFSPRSLPRKFSLQVLSPQGVPGTIPPFPSSPKSSPSPQDSQVVSPSFPSSPPKVPSSPPVVIPSSPKISSPPVTIPSSPQTYPMVPPSPQDSPPMVLPSSPKISSPMVPPSSPKISSPPVTIPSFPSSPQASPPQASLSSLDSPSSSDLQETSFNPTAIELKPFLRVAGLSIVNGKWTYPSKLQPQLADFIKAAISTPFTPQLFPPLQSKEGKATLIPLSSYEGDCLGKLLLPGLRNLFDEKIATRLLSCQESITPGDLPEYLRILYNYVRAKGDYSRIPIRRGDIVVLNQRWFGVEDKTLIPIKKTLPEGWTCPHPFSINYWDSLPTLGLRPNLAESTLTLEKLPSSYYLYAKDLPHYYRGKCRDKEYFLYFQKSHPDYPSVLQNPATTYQLLDEESLLLVCP